MVNMDEDGAWWCGCADVHGSPIAPDVRPVSGSPFRGESPDKRGLGPKPQSCVGSFPASIWKKVYFFGDKKWWGENHRTADCNCSEADKGLSLWKNMLIGLSCWPLCHGFAMFCLLVAGCPRQSSDWAIVPLLMISCSAGSFKRTCCSTSSVMSHEKL